MPVLILVAFTRVTVGKTECAFLYHTPSVFSRCRCGIVSGVTESGRSPSTTKTITSPGRALSPAESRRHARKARKGVFNITVTSPGAVERCTALASQHSLTASRCKQRMKLGARVTPGDFLWLREPWNNRQYS